MVFGKRYEGILYPDPSGTPYKIIDDPALIEKKNKMRAALREEYTKKMYNPYRRATGIGGHPFDPMLIRYNSMMRTQTQYFRPGPRFAAVTAAFILPIMLVVYLQEKKIRENNYKIYTGQVSYEDRAYEIKYT